jgi:hypothetical protein
MWVSEKRRVGVGMAVTPVVTFERQWIYEKRVVATIEEPSAQVCTEVVTSCHCTVEFPSQNVSP